MELMLVQTLLRYARFSGSEKNTQIRQHIEETCKKDWRTVKKDSRLDLT